VNEVTTVETRTGCIGLVSNCGDHYHYFFDFDGFKDDAILYSAMYISQEAKCDLLIRRSSEQNFHVICPNPMSQNEVVSLQRLTPRDPTDLYLHLDDVLFLGGQRGTGNTLRLYGKHQKAPKTEFMLWVGDRPICHSYVKLFNLKLPSGKKIHNCGSPTYAYYTTRLQKEEPV